MAHINDARRIIEDEAIKARIVYDESLLNQSRTHVSWVSPNSWNNGSMYGTVEFHFPWLNLVSGKKLYWIEAITKYNPTAYRFLVTDRNVSHLSVAKPYDPQTDDGPVKLRGNDWFWNGKFTAEFMIEEDLMLSDCKRIRSIKHNDRYCRLHKSGCTEKHYLFGRSAASILSYVLAVDTHTVDHALMPDIGLPGGQLSTEFVEHGASEFWMRVVLGKIATYGTIEDKADAITICRAALLSFSMGDKTKARALINMLASEETFVQSLKTLVRDHFGDRSLLRDWN